MPLPSRQRKPCASSTAFLRFSNGWRIQGDDRAEAERFIAEGKNVVLITCSIHATEVASTHSAVEFAYRILTEESRRFVEIRANTILILVPSLNPDGVDIVTRWYRTTLGKPFEGTSPPELCQKYVGHDNNRDWYIFSQPETRAVISQLHNVWHPEIVYDVHQQGATGSRISIPPWLDPIEPNVDAILAQEMNMIGTSMATDLTAAGKTGVAISASYDFWTPSRHYRAFHGGLRILTESASARLASPITIAPEQLDKDALGYNARQRSEIFWSRGRAARGGFETLWITNWLRSNRASIRRRFIARICCGISIKWGSGRWHGRRLGRS